MSKKGFRSHSMGNNASGSPFPGEPEFLAVGKLRRPHGLKGEIVMSVWTDFPERLIPGYEVFVGQKHFPLKIRSVRKFMNDLLISFDELETRESVGEYRNHVVFVRAEALPPLEEGEYYLSQLLGLRVVHEEKDEILGVLVEIIETGANRVFVVRPEQGKDILLPDIESVVRQINFEKGEMYVNLLPGLIE